MEIVLPIISFGASLLTFFSGFGLGSILLPVFLGFYEPVTAVAATAIVHFVNNLFKLSLLRAHVDRKLALGFGVPAWITAIFGAFALRALGSQKALWTYTLGTETFVVRPIGLTFGVVMIVFAALELKPRLLSRWVPERFWSGQKGLVLGGALSGFFGGLSGHQGAIRSFVLSRVRISPISKETLLATGILIACVTDLARLSTYRLSPIFDLPVREHKWIVIAIISAILGSLIGNRFLKKITLPTLQKGIAFLFVVFAVLMGAGIV